MIPVGHLQVKGGAFMHSDTPYIDQSPEALSLTVTEGALDRTQFHLLSVQDCKLAGVAISAAVIGASHIVTYDTGIFRLHEIFACVGLENVSCWSLADLVRAPVVREYPGFTYTFEAEVVAWDDPEPTVLTDMIQQAAMLRESGGDAQNNRAGPSIRERPRGRFYYRTLLSECPRAGYQSLGTPMPLKGVF